MALVKLKEGEKEALDLFPLYFPLSLLLIGFAFWLLEAPLWDFILPTTALVLLVYFLRSIKIVSETERTSVRDLPCQKVLWECWKSERFFILIHVFGACAYIFLSLRALTHLAFFKSFDPEGALRLLAKRVVLPTSPIIVLAVMQRIWPEKIIALIGRKLSQKIALWVKCFLAWCLGIRLLGLLGGDKNLFLVAVLVAFVLIVWGVVMTISSITPSQRIAGFRERFLKSRSIWRYYVFAGSLLLLIWVGLVICGWKFLLWTWLLNQQGNILQMAPIHTAVGIDIPLVMLLGGLNWAAALVIAVLYLLPHFCEDKVDEYYYSSDRPEDQPQPYLLRDEEGTKEKNARERIRKILSHLYANIFLRALNREHPLECFAGFTFHVLITFSPWVVLLLQEKLSIFGLYHAEGSTLAGYILGFLGASHLERRTTLEYGLNIALFNAWGASFFIFAAPFIRGYVNIDEYYRKDSSHVLRNRVIGELDKHVVLIGYGNLGRLLVHHILKYFADFGDLTSDDSRKPILGREDFNYLIDRQGRIALICKKLIIIEQREEVFLEMFSIPGQKEECGYLMSEPENILASEYTKKGPERQQEKDLGKEEDRTDEGASAGNQSRNFPRLGIAAIHGSGESRHNLRLAKIAQAKVTLEATNDLNMPFRLVHILETDHIVPKAILTVQDTAAIATLLPKTHKFPTFLTYPYVEEGDYVARALQSVFQKLEGLGKMPNTLIIGREKIVFYTILNLIKLYKDSDAVLSKLYLVTDDEYVASETKTAWPLELEKTYWHVVPFRGKKDSPGNDRDYSRECIIRADVAHELSNYESLLKAMRAHKPKVVFIYTNQRYETFRILNEVINVLRINPYGDIVIPHIIVSCLFQERQQIEGRIKAEFETLVPQERRAEGNWNMFPEPEDLVLSHDDVVSHHITSITNAFLLRQKDQSIAEMNFCVSDHPGSLLRLLIMLSGFGKVEVDGRKRLFDFVSERICDRMKQNEPLPSFHYFYITSNICCTLLRPGDTESPTEKKRCFIFRAIVDFPSAGIIKEAFVHFINGLFMETEKSILAEKVANTVESFQPKTGDAADGQVPEGCPQLTYLCPLSMFDETKGMFNETKETPHVSPLRYFPRPSRSCLRDSSHEWGLPKYYFSVLIEGAEPGSLASALWDLIIMNKGLSCDNMAGAEDSFFSHFVNNFECSHSAELTLIKIFAREIKKEKDKQLRERFNALFNRPRVLAVLIQGPPKDERVSEFIDDLSEYLSSCPVDSGNTGDRDLRDLFLWRSKRLYERSKAGIRELLSFSPELKGTAPQD